ncbi:MAG: hypothetical protein U0324_47630 [Polyangiales bacterium]
MKPAAGVLLDQRYELVAPLPDRGVGESWRATDKQHTDRAVSVKLLKPLAAGVTALPRDLADALRALRAFRHDNVPAVLNQGVWDARPYLVYDPVEGRSIGAALDEARQAETLLPLALLEALFDHTCRAFDAGHRAPRQVLHLGLTPGSVLYHGDAPDLSVSIVDFGLAKYAAPDPTAPVRSARALSFPAPEQLKPDGSTGPHTDVFSLGGLLREMLSLPPELGLTLSPAGLERRRDDVPDALWEVVSRAMSSNPADRFASAEALREAASNAWRTPVRAKPIAPVPQPPAPAPAPQPAVAAPLAPLAPLPISSPQPRPAPLRAPAFSTEPDEAATTEVAITPAERLAAKAALESRARVATRSSPSFVSAPVIKPSTQLPAFSPAPPAAPPVSAPSFPTEEEDDDRFGRTVAIEEAGLAVPAVATLDAAPHADPDADVAATQEIGEVPQIERTVAFDQPPVAVAADADDDALLRTMAVDQNALEHHIAQQPQQAPQAPVRAPIGQPAPKAPIAAPLSNALPPPTPMPALDAPKIVSTPKSDPAPRGPVDPSETARYRLIVAVGILFIPVLLGLFLILRARH